MKARILIAGLALISQGAFATSELKGTWTPVKSDCSSGAPYDEGNGPEVKRALQKQTLEITDDTVRVTMEGLVDFEKQANVTCSSTIGFKYVARDSLIQAGPMTEATSTCPIEIGAGDAGVEASTSKFEVDGNSLKITPLQPMEAGDACPVGDTSTTYFTRVN